MTKGGGWGITAAPASLKSAPDRRDAPLPGKCFIRRCEIWEVDSPASMGAEVVANADDVGVVPIKLVAPLTGWNESYANKISFVRIVPDKDNGLSKTSGADVLNLHGVSTLRFGRRHGRLTTDLMYEIAAAIAAVVEYR